MVNGVPKVSLRENLGIFESSFWNLWLWRKYVKVLPLSSQRNTQSSQSYILRRFAFMRTQSLTTLFLCLGFRHLKFSYIREISRESTFYDINCTTARLHDCTIYNNKCATRNFRHPNCRTAKLQNCKTLHLHTLRKDCSVNLFNKTLEDCARSDFIKSGCSSCKHVFH
jgi:hypothetical protein